MSTFTYVLRFFIVKVTENTTQISINKVSLLTYESEILEFIFRLQERIDPRA